MTPIRDTPDTVTVADLLRRAAADHSARGYVDMPVAAVRALADALDALERRVAAVEGAQARGRTGQDGAGARLQADDGAAGRVARPRGAGGPPGAACPCRDPLPHAPGEPVCVSAAWLRKTLGFDTSADASDNLAGLRADLAQRGDRVGVATLDRVLVQLARVRVAATGRDARTVGAWEGVLAMVDGKRTPQAGQDEPGAMLGGAEASGQGMQHGEPPPDHSALRMTVSGYSGVAR